MIEHRWSAPTRLQDAVAALAADPAARPVAGGTDLVVGARQGRKPLPSSLVGIDRVAELAGQRVDHDALVLGALTTHAWLASSPDVLTRLTALADAAAIVGSPATRAIGTLGGNLMNASPAADTVGPLICAEAMVTLAGPGGSRTIAVAELANGPGRTVANADELLVDVRVPSLLESSGSAYVRLEYRAAMEIAVVGAAAAVTLLEGRIADARIALTAVAPTIIRSAAAEAALRERPAESSTFAAAGDAAAGDSAPISDVRASADYRRAMVKVVVARAVRAAVERALGRDILVPASRWAHGQAL